MKRLLFSLIWILLSVLVTVQTTYVFSHLDASSIAFNMSEEAHGGDEDSDERKDLDKSLNKILSSSGTYILSISHFTKYDQRYDHVEDEVNCPPPKTGTSVA